MVEYIEREEAIKKAVGALHGVSHVQAVDIVNAIEEIPAVQVETEDDIAQKVRERCRRAVTKKMTTEIICKNLRDMLCDPLCKGEMTGNQIEAVREAINALSAQQEAERNEPLTSPPCKIGDRFWIIAYSERQVIQAECYGYVIMKPPTICRDENYIWVNNVENPHDFWKINFADFKNECFATEEDAQKYL